MTSNEIRTKFLQFFENKKHNIVSSAPLVVKNDPTLMFTNAGMNQFKELFLGNSKIVYPRIANSQKCLRVSGKHNDLEEVGHDTYHHTMFEMLGNWSFADYFKKEAIAWAWELLVDEYKIPKDRLYVTVFEGSKEDKLEADNEALEIWSKYIDKDRIIYGSKKDNFWEMGDTGPCGPCSEIHVDIRDDADRNKIDGKTLVNQSNPLVIEIWNLVFIQFNRKADKSLESLPGKHVDTGMGFERLCMVIQGKKSNYDTDVFQPIIAAIAKKTNIKYNENEKSDIAMRVIADHLRAVSFAIADGEIPSNTGAGYVIRRILRRAVRYGFTFLNQSEPFIYMLVETLSNSMGHAFPEIKKQQQLVEKVIKEEEISFLRTLETGIKLLDEFILESKKQKSLVLDGKTAFKLYDTFGFPLDLTELILKENGLTVNKKEFDAEMEQQKNRSRQASSLETFDWVTVQNFDTFDFVGYDKIVSEVKISKYRKVISKDKEMFQLVFNNSPFYAESGGQVGDSGYIESSDERIIILDTKKENNLPIHLTEKLPSDLKTAFKAFVNSNKRNDIASNHSATHLLHFALRNVLGTHVEQKGSLVNSDYLRFDFSHFQKMTDEEIQKVETMVNSFIRMNITLEEFRDISMDEAKKKGAMALFGEKYGDKVRMIKFGDSIELCGGTHVKATGLIGYFKLVSESAIAAGIRRIEAISGTKANEYIAEMETKLEQLNELLKSPKDIIKSIQQLLDENAGLKKQIEKFAKENIKIIKAELISKMHVKNGINVISSIIEIDSAASLKDLAFQLKGESENLVLILGASIQDKANLAVMISENLVKEKNIHAGNIIKEIAKDINGGGGGQAFFATAGGTNKGGLQDAIDKALKMI